MSLINEALKRAEQEKRRHSGRDAGLPPSLGVPLLQSSDSTDLPPDPMPQPRGSTLRPKLLAAGALLAVAGALFLIWSAGRDRTTAEPADSPRSAEASVEQPAVPQPQPASPTPVTPMPGFSQPVTAPPPPGKIVLRELPPAPPAPAPVASPPEPQSPPPGPVATVAAPADTPATPAPPAPVAATPVDPDVAHFKLIGIMRLGGRATASVNGELLQVGDSLDGATVVAIGRRWVELERHSRRFKIYL